LGVHPLAVLVVDREALGAEAIVVGLAAEATLAVAALTWE